MKSVVVETFTVYMIDITFFINVVRPVRFSIKEGIEINRDRRKKIQP